ncbi:MAG TPA: LOG family protein, partial [Acidimicrobiia bacterium]|nr:LOG family protein [Acidimicrobiia bacterium]
IKPDDPHYDLTRELAHAIAERDWMVLTGAGPGIMTAGIEGAGTENSFGVNIRLPFEAVTSEFIADDPKLINFRYFFTRKLTFVKESDGFALLPGGFGTLDEAFELLTLVQTGKAEPVPIVLLQAPGETYWDSWRRFVDDELCSRGLISPEDLDLVTITSDVDEAVDEIIGFYANYHSLRFVRGELVLRMRDTPTPEDVEALNEEFKDIVVRGRIETREPTDDEVADDDHLELGRIAFRFDRAQWGRLRHLIDALNGRRRSTQRA